MIPGTAISKVGQLLSNLTAQAGRMTNKSCSSPRQPSTNHHRSSAPPRAAARLRREAGVRIVRLHHLIKDGSFPNLASAARALDSTCRTIKRDFQFLRVHHHAPLAYDRQRHGYFYTEPSFTLPGGPSVTEAELFAVLVAHKAIAQYHGTPFHQPLQMAFQKLTGQLDRHERYTMEHLREAVSFRPLAPEDADLETFQTVTRALQQRRVVKFHYRKPGQKELQLREVHTYHLTCGENRWYLLGYDTDAADVRTFALGRISAPVLTDQRFEKPASFDPNKYLGASFGVMKGDGDYEVVIEFDAWATDQLRGRQWHPTQTVRELPGGGSRLRMRLSGLEEVERWILSWGTHANVLQPAPLAVRLREIAAKLVERYLAVQLADTAPVTSTNGLTLNL